MNIDQCEGCYYNRPITAWGETFMACWYTRDNKGKELHGDNECSGYETAEKQLELSLEEST